MEKDVFLTISQETDGFYKEKGSKFIGYAFPVRDTSQIKEKLEFLKKEHHSSRHVCYGWVLGNQGENYRANDDGEPSNSAGKPILAQIQGRDLTNTLVAVVRYFGGTKLGVGGLISAYRTAAKEALDINIIIEKYVIQRIRLSFSYDQISPVLRILKEEGLQPEDQKFEQVCSLQVEIRISQIKRVREKLNIIPNLEWSDPIVQ